jgi:hypothetical protein
VRLVAETARPQAYVALHSGEFALYAPWDSEARARGRLGACEGRGSGVWRSRDGDYEELCCTGGIGVPGRRGCAAPRAVAAGGIAAARARAPASRGRRLCPRRRVSDAGPCARTVQASLAPDLPADLMDVLANLNAYCQCMYGAAGKVAGCAPPAVRVD